MATPKTQMTNASVQALIQKVPDTEKRADAKELLKLFKEITGLSPKVWGTGTSFIGYGSYHYKSERSAQEGYWPLTGFSPRKANLTIYIMTGPKKYAALLKKLGPHKASMGCLYIKRLSDIHVPTLKKIISSSVKEMRRKHKV